MPTLRQRSASGNRVEKRCSACNRRCGRFLIRCDECNEYYFISCHEITKDMAEQMSRFYCLPCRRKNPSLHVTYKETPDEKGVHISWSDCGVLRHKWEQLQHGPQRRRLPGDECEFAGGIYRTNKCICTVPNECSPYSIQCQECSRWCHYECEGFTFKTGKEISAYYCHRCRYGYDLSIEYRARRKKPHMSGNPPKGLCTHGRINERPDNVNVGNPLEASSPVALPPVVNLSEPELQPEVNQLAAEQNAIGLDRPQQSQQHAIGARDAHAPGLLVAQTRLIRFGQLYRGKNRLVHANNSSVRELQTTINEKNALVRQLKVAAKQQADKLQRSKDESSRIMDEKNTDIRTLQERLAAAEQLGHSTSRSGDVRCDHDAEIQRLKEESRQLADKVRDREAVIVRLTLAANGFAS